MEDNKQNAPEEASASNVEKINETLETTQEIQVENTSEETPTETAPSITEEVIPSSSTPNLEEAVDESENKPNSTIDAAATEAVTQEEDILPLVEEPAEEISVVGENQDEIKNETPNNTEDIEHLDEDEHEEHFVIEDDVDYAAFDKKEFLALAERMYEALKKADIKIADVKNIDTVYRELRASFDEKQAQDKSAALAAYKAENGNEDGFEFKNDNVDIKFETLMIKIREEKTNFFKKLEAKREDYFDVKTNLLQKLREIVEQEEQGGSRENWEAFKKIQNDWRDAGNISSPHNGTFWSAYNALVDRYFDIRSIQNELKDLDRKKNLEARTELVEKIEAIAASLSNEELSRPLLKRANDLLNEYKHTGPGPRAEQEALWTRMKAAFDVIYEHRRKQTDESKSLMEEVLNAKVILIERLKEFQEFDSGSINEWNAKTKEVLEVQEQWNKLKGPMPRDKAKDVSKDFWAAIKTFFRNKSAFFAKLEAQREDNLKAKQALCTEAEALLAEGDASAEKTNKIIELQKTWKTIGHVPEKFKNSIYDQFKKACDDFFELKRAGNKEQENSYKANLKAKQNLCDKIDAEAKSGEANLGNLSEYKKQFAEIGFVPRNDMNTIQKRFIKSINDYVKSASNLNKDEKEKLLLQNEVEVTLNTGGNPKNIQKQDQDLRRKLKTLEDEINQLKTNIEFFRHSKNADKFRDEYQKKIERAEEEAAKISEKIQLINAAS